MNVHNSCDIAGICPNDEKLVAELRAAGVNVDDVIVDSSGKRVDACVDACGTDPNGGLTFLHHPWGWLLGLHHHGEWPAEWTARDARVLPRTSFAAGRRALLMARRRSRCIR